MRHRGLVHGLAWTLATGAAVTLSWWGVHTVMTGTVYDRPRALPLTSPSGSGSQDAHPQASSTHRPRTSPQPGASDGEDGEDGSSPGSGESGGKPSDSSARPPGTGAPSTGTPGGGSGTKPARNVRSYTVSGGRVAFEIGAESAELVSATPESGWQMQVWKQPEWIRVTFTQGGREASVFCTWHDQAPRVQIDER